MHHVKEGSGCRPHEARLYGAHCDRRGCARLDRDGAPTISRTCLVIASSSSHLGVGQSVGMFIPIKATREGHIKDSQPLLYYVLG